MCGRGCDNRGRYLQGRRPGRDRSIRRNGSDDHQAIKKHLGLSPTDRVYIDIGGNVWAENTERYLGESWRGGRFHRRGEAQWSQRQRPDRNDRFSESAVAEGYHIILRIRHPDLDPAEITAALGWKPHHFWKRGVSGDHAEGQQAPEIAGGRSLESNLSISGKRRDRRALRSNSKSSADLQGLVRGIGASEALNWHYICSSPDTLITGTI